MIKSKIFRIIFFLLVVGCIFAGCFYFEFDKEKVIEPTPNSTELNTTLPDNKNGPENPVIPEITPEVTEITPTVDGIKTTSVEEISNPMLLISKCEDSIKKSNHDSKSICKKKVIDEFFNKKNFDYDVAIQLLNTTDNYKLPSFLSLEQINELIAASFNLKSQIFFKKSDSLILKNGRFYVAFKSSPKEAFKKYGWVHKNFKGIEAKQHIFYPEVAMKEMNNSVGIIDKSHLLNSSNLKKLEPHQVININEIQQNLTNMNLFLQDAKKLDLKSVIEIMKLHQQLNKPDKGIDEVKLEYFFVKNTTNSFQLVAESIEFIKDWPIWKLCYLVRFCTYGWQMKINDGREIPVSEILSFFDKNNYVKESFCSFLEMINIDVLNDIFSANFVNKNKELC